MTRAWALLVLVLFMPGSALSDSSNLGGGVFIAHHPPGLQYTSGQDYCQRYFQDFAIDSCSEQNTRIDLDGNQDQTSVWYVLAAWSEEKEWCGAEFGFAAFDSTIYAFTHWGPCFPEGDGLQIATTGWPGPDAGVSLSISDTPWSGNFVPIYWLEGYAYAEGEISLAANPSTAFGGTANCENPPQSWPATAFGGMGIFQDGTAACPEGLDGGGGGLDGGMQPDGADGYGGYEGDEGQGGEADTVACCFGGDCRLLIADECERLGGLVRSDWRSCDLTPCRNYPPGGLDNPTPPEELYPLVSRIVCAQAETPAVFYLDPGEDSQLSFHVCTMDPASSTTLTLSLYDPRDLGSGPFYSEENVVVGPPPGHYVTRRSWSRASGMAKLVITTVQGAGHYYAFAPLNMEDPADTDHEYFNSNFAARPGYYLPSDWTARYRFWVPTMADSIRLRCLSEWGGTWGCTGCTLRDPEGNIVYERDYSGQPDTYLAAVDEADRGGTWELCIDTWDWQCIGYPVHGRLQVSFLAEGATEWWTPDFAFNTVPENPVRAQFSPWDSFAAFTVGLPWGFHDLATYYVPYGSPVDAYDTRPMDPSPTLAWCGRRDLMFGALESDRSVTLLHAGGNRVDFTWHTSADPSDTRDSVSVNQLSWMQSVPQGEILFISTRDGGAVDIITDAPLAVAGPRPGLEWSKAVFDAASSEDMIFFVPSDVDILEMTLEAWRGCAREDHDECVADPQQMLNRAYPPTDLVLTDPGGGVYSFHVDKTTHGRLEIALPLEGPLAKYRGHAWKVRVETTDPHTGLSISLLFGDDLPPYATWVPEKERLFLPLTWPRTPTMVHDVTPYAFGWNVVPPSDLYFAAARTCKVVGDEWVCAEPIWPAEQELSRDVYPQGQANKEMLLAAHEMWLPIPVSDMPGDLMPMLMSAPLLSYAVSRPLGQTDDGSLRTTIGGVPQEPKQFIELNGATPGGPEGERHLVDTRACGFHSVSVPWENGQAGWADSAFALGMVPGIGLPGIGAWGQDWELFEEKAEVIAGEGHILSTTICDEPLAVNDYDTDDLYEAAYRLRQHNDRQPLMINEEPSLVWTRDLRDIVDVWSEDQYSLRWFPSEPQQRWPSCEVVTRIREIQSRVRAGTGVGIFLLAGFPDAPRQPYPSDHYVSATRDSLGSEVLSAILLGADWIGLFCKVFNEQRDLQTSNAALWDSIPDLAGAWDKVERYIRSNDVYDIGVRGTVVDECEWPPVSFGYGKWDELQEEGLVGTWFAFCNLAREATWSEVLSWWDLRLPYAAGPALWWDGWSTPEPYCAPLPDGLHLVLAPGQWIVGKLVLQMEPGAVLDPEMGTGRLSIRAVPNPTGLAPEFRVRSGVDGFVRLALLDVSGREVWESLEQVRAGENTLRWGGRTSAGGTAPSGLYRALLKDEVSGTQRSCWVLRLR